MLGSKLVELFEKDWGRGLVGGVCIMGRVSEVSKAHTRASFNLSVSNLQITYKLSTTAPAPHLSAAMLPTMMAMAPPD